MVQLGSSCYWLTRTGPWNGSWPGGVSERDSREEEQTDAQQHNNSTMKELPRIYQMGLVRGVGRHTDTHSEKTHMAWRRGAQPSLTRNDSLGGGAPAACSLAEVAVAKLQAGAGQGMQGQRLSAKASLLHT